MSRSTTTRRAVLIHGVASDSKMWEQAGWPSLLKDLGIATTYAALPGHRESSLAPDAPQDAVTSMVLGADPNATILVGFSAGAALALSAAAREPDRFEHIVLLGIGDAMWTTSVALAATAQQLQQEDSDPHTRLMRGMITESGNDLNDVALFIEVTPSLPAPRELRKISARVLVVLGDQDAVGPADRLLESLNDVCFASLPRVDHFRTPTSFLAMQAASGFLAR